jgi:hypothetical protein
MNPVSGPGRRDFVKSATTGLLILNSRTAFGSQANSTVELGLIGCGGRGNWIGPFFPEFTGARIVALADVIKDHLDSTRPKFNVEESWAYYGPDAYKEAADRLATFRRKMRAFEQRGISGLWIGGARVFVSRTCFAVTKQGSLIPLCTRHH